MTGYDFKYPVYRKTISHKFIQSRTGNNSLRIGNIVQQIILLSSSDNTSSSSNTGVSEMDFLTSSSSDNFNDNADVLCCPCEPYFRISTSPIENSRSSLCGHTDV